MKIVLKPVDMEGSLGGGMSSSYHLNITSFPSPISYRTGDIPLRYRSYNISFRLARNQ
jgi:hypothetical protein